MAGLLAGAKFAQQETGGVVQLVAGAELTSRAVRRGEGAARVRVVRRVRRRVWVNMVIAEGTLVWRMLG